MCAEVWQGLAAAWDIHSQGKDIRQGSLRGVWGQEPSNQAMGERKQWDQAPGGMNNELGYRWETDHGPRREDGDPFKQSGRLHGLDSLSGPQWVRGRS